jgi:hypothetical protein
MKNIIKQTCIGWIGNEIGKEIFVVIDSSPITSSSCNEAERLIEEGRSVPGFVPFVFLDKELDSPELRSWLQSEATRRFVSAKSNTMKEIISAVIVLALIFGMSFKAVAQTAQYVTLNSTANANGVNFAVQTNQILSLVGYDWFDVPRLNGYFPDGTVVSLTPYYNNGSGPAVSPQIPQIITGITNINVKPLGSIPGFATFQIMPSVSANVVSNYVPADAIVIPASATGNVQIILESSTDLVNWTAADPGTYGASSATNRFFRVRAVHN